MKITGWFCPSVSSRLALCVRACVLSIPANFTTNYPTITPIGLGGCPESQKYGSRSIRACRIHTFDWFTTEAVGGIVPSTGGVTVKRTFTFTHWPVNHAVMQSPTFSFRLLMPKSELKLRINSWANLKNHYTVKAWKPFRWRHITSHWTTTGSLLSAQCIPIPIFKQNAYLTASIWKQVTVSNN